LATFLIAHPLVRLSPADFYIRSIYEVNYRDRP
jgi:hypothetical protein